MSTNCTTEIVPIYQEDPCMGDKKSTKCVYDENMYTELGLEVNSTQEQINQALYIAFVALKAEINSL